MRALLLALLVVAAAGPACVTTQQVDPDRSPDPRDDLPELAAPAPSPAELKRAQLAAEHPLATVVALSDAEPQAELRVVLSTGSADDPAGKEGIAGLLARLLGHGTEKLTAAELAETLTRMSATLDVRADKDAIALTGRVPREHAAAYAELLLDVLLHPRLTAEELDRCKDEQRAQLREPPRDGPESSMSRATLEALIYGGATFVPGAFKEGARHGYAHATAGTPAGIDAVTIEDVRGLHERALVRDRLVLGVAGSAPTALVARLTSALEALPFSDGERAPPAPPAQPDNNVLVVVETPTAGATIAVGFALADLARTHADYPALAVAMAWLSEHRAPVDHVLDAAHTRRGVGLGECDAQGPPPTGQIACLAPGLPRRSWHFSSWVGPVERKSRLFMLRQTLDELDRFVRDGIPDDESFARAQAAVQASGQRAMAGATRADVNAAIKRHLRADRLSLVVVTDDGSAFAADVAANKRAPPVYLAPKVDKARRGEDARIDAVDLRIAADHVVVVKPDALVGR